MGSATTSARAASHAALASLAREQAGASDREAYRATQGVLGRHLLVAARVLGSSQQLLSCFADPGTSVEVKRTIVERLFRELVPAARELVITLASYRWSRSSDLVAGIEEMGICALTLAAPSGVSVERELFDLGRIVAGNAELELALGSKLSSSDAKTQLVTRLLNGKVSDSTLEIVKHLVLHPRGRRVGELFREAGSIAATQEGYQVAIVTVARSLSGGQLARLEKVLTEMYSQKLRVNQVIDPDVMGGIRIRLGDDVIDGSVASRVHDLRMKLAS